LEGVAAGAFFLPLRVALGLAGVSVFCWSGTTQVDVKMHELTGRSGKAVASIVSEKLLLDDTWSGATISMSCACERSELSMTYPRCWM
jgi:hypothetical protein